MHAEQHNIDGKKEEVKSMFDSIAPAYDLLNHLLSFGIDRRWRRIALKKVLAGRKPSRILDIATGTGDLAIGAAKYNPLKITALDISGNMLEIAGAKIRKKGLSDKIELVKGESEKLPFPDNSFEVVMSAFGVRNFADPEAGLNEMVRVNTYGGTVMILEFSKPGNNLFGKIFRFYFFRILPLIGHLVSGHRRAYRYLPASVDTFPGKNEFVKWMEKAGLKEITCRSFTGGIVTLYLGTRKAD